METYIKILAILFTILIGLCVGSFLNVVIYRLPRHMSLAKPSSHCPKCQNPIKWYDNIPVLSYIFLRGRCRHCKQKISFRYPFVEILNAVLWFFALMFDTNIIFQSITPNYIMLGVHFVAISCLICVAFCDFDNMEIPDEFQILLLICGIVSFLSGDAKDRVFGFLLVGGFFALFAGLFYLLRKKEGLGFGDIKLMAVLGLILGFANTILTIILSTVIGAIVLLILSIKNKKEKDKEYPFAVFIAPCAIIAMFVGKFVVNWYISLLGIV